MTASRRIAVVLGTRPEIIKTAEIIRLLGDRVLLIHTGQHWDHMMSGHFMTHLDLPEPHFTLSVGGASRAVQIAETLAGVTKVLESEQPAAVVVQGDTNTVLGGALAANASGIQLIHIEAGLRSFDRSMPEEHNRVVTDHLSDLCLAPTTANRDRLLSEGIGRDRIVVTGNTVVGAVEHALVSGAEPATTLCLDHHLSPDEFVVVTLHRPENTDDPRQLESILGVLGQVSAMRPVLFPMHPRTRARIAEFGLESAIAPLLVVDPLGYDEFVALCARAALTISDSGGIQEEASVWKRPVIVLRRSTERQEVQGTFAYLCPSASELVGLAESLIGQADRLLPQLLRSPTPYGDGHAANRCVEAILDRVDR